MKYELKIPLNKIQNFMNDPMKMMRYGRPTLTHNEALGMMVDAFIAKYMRFPLRFKPCKHTQTVEGQYMVIRFSEEGVETRALKNRYGEI